MNVAIYLRKSRAEENAVSLEDTLHRHKETLLEFAKNNHLTILKIYEEVVSGESLYARPEMLQLLSEVENGKYDAVLVMDIDRLGRGAMSDQGVILETFKASDTKIITPRKIYDLNNEFDEEYTEFETFIARRELSLIKRRMQRGIQKSLEDGSYIANAPYGYKKTKVGKQPTLEIYEPEAKFVRLIFDLYVNEGIGVQAISERLTQMGAVSHRSNAFPKTTVLKILRNQVYIGKVVWNQKTYTKKNGKKIVTYNPPSKWKIIDGIHPPIIDQELFEKANDILSRKYHPPKNNGILYNPLAGLVVCEKCGKQMVRRKYTTWGSKQREVNYICTTKGCTPYERMENVERAIIEHLYHLFLQIQTKAKQQNKNSNTIQASMTAIDREYLACLKQKDRLHDLLEQGVYDIDTFVQRSQILTEKINRLKITKNDLIRQLHQEETDKFYLLPDFVILFDNYWSGSPEEKNKLLKKVVDHIVYRKEHNSQLGNFSLSIYLK